MVRVCPRLFYGLLCALACGPASERSDDSPKRSARRSSRWVRSRVAAFLFCIKGPFVYPSVGLIDREIRDVFEKQTQYQVNLYIDYMGDDTFKTLEWEAQAS